MRCLILALVFFAATKGYGEIQFVGVVSVGNRTFFAIRAEESSPAKWMPLGDSVDGFVISSYEARSETLTLRKGAENLTLILPESHVRMASNEVIAGLRKALNRPDAAQPADLFHPKLRSYFDLGDRDSLLYQSLTGLEAKIVAGATVEIRELTREELDKFDARLVELQNLLGSRPNYGMWVLVDGKISSMTFVAKVGDSWYLTPSLPKK